MVIKISLKCHLDNQTASRARKVGSHVELCSTAATPYPHNLLPPAPPCQPSPRKHFLTFLSAPHLPSPLPPTPTPFLDPPPPPPNEKAPPPRPGEGVPSRFTRVRRFTD